jgi:hypothetical protein
MYGSLEAVCSQIPSILFKILNLFEFDPEFPEFPEFWVSRGVPKFFLSQEKKPWLGMRTLPNRMLSHPPLVLLPPATGQTRSKKPTTAILVN